METVVQLEPADLKVQLNISDSNPDQKDDEKTMLGPFCIIAKYFEQYGTIEQEPISNFHQQIQLLVEMGQSDRAHQLLLETLTALKFSDMFHIDSYKKIMLLMMDKKVDTSLIKLIKNQKEINTVEQKSETVKQQDSISPTLKVWKSIRPSTPGNLEISKTQVTRQRTNSVLSPLSPLLSPVLSPANDLPDTLMLLRNSNESNDQYEGVDYEQLIIWQLFKKAEKSGHHLDYEVNLAFTNFLCERCDYKKALDVILTLPENQWDLEVYKFMIFIYLCKKPQEVESAKRLLDRLPTQRLATRTKALDGSVQTQHQQPSIADQHILWFYFNSLQKEAKWTDCIERYEEAKLNASDHKHTFLDNAIMEVCLKYAQYEHGWQIYEQMKEIDKHTPAIAITICWKAFMFFLGKESESEKLFEWEARAWAVYSRFQTLDAQQKLFSLQYVQMRMIEIAKESPQTESRKLKLERINSHQL